MELMSKDGTKSTTVYADHLEDNNFHKVASEVKGQIFVAYRYETSGDCDWELRDSGRRPHKISGAKTGILDYRIKRYKLLPFSNDAPQTSSQDPPCKGDKCQESKDHQDDRMASDSKDEPPNESSKIMKTSFFLSVLPIIISLLIK